MFLLSVGDPFLSVVGDPFLSVVGEHLVKTCIPSN